MIRLKPTQFVWVHMLVGAGCVRVSELDFEEISHFSSISLRPRLVPSVSSSNKTVRTKNTSLKTALRGHNTCRRSEVESAGSDSSGGPQLLSGHF